MYLYMFRLTGYAPRNLDHILFIHGYNLWTYIYDIYYFYKDNSLPEHMYSGIKITVCCFIVDFIIFLA